jgi:hypothetical protein
MLMRLQMAYANFDASNRRRKIGLYQHMVIGIKIELRYILLFLKFGKIDIIHMWSLSNGFDTKTFQSNY